MSMEKVCQFGNGGRHPISPRKPKWGASDQGVNAVFAGVGNGMLDNVDHSGVGATKDDDQAPARTENQGLVIRKCVDVVVLAIPEFLTGLGLFKSGDSRYLTGQKDFRDNFLKITVENKIGAEGGKQWPFERNPFECALATLLLQPAVAEYFGMGMDIHLSFQMEDFRQTAAMIVVTVAEDDLSRERRSLPNSRAFPITNFHCLCRNRYSPSVSPPERQSRALRFPDGLRNFRREG